MLAARTLRTLGARSLAARGTQSRLAAQKLPVVATQTRNFALAHKTEIDDERMPTTYADYSNHVLLMLSAHGDDQAIRERMVRDVMKVDSVDHLEAETKVQEIEQAAKSGLAMSRLPYRVGIAAALVAGFGSIPMCFDLHTVLWFNEQYVTMDVEDAKNLETWLEVGSWSWNWMEPPLGQASFFLLCLQYSRDQMKNIGMKTYTERVRPPVSFLRRAAATASGGLLRFGTPSPRPSRRWRGMRWRTSSPESPLQRASSKC